MEWSSGNRHCVVEAAGRDKQRKNEGGGRGWDDYGWMKR